MYPVSAWSFFFFFVFVFVSPRPLFFSLLNNWKSQIKFVPFYCSLLLSFSARSASLSTCFMVLSFSFLFSSLLFKIVKTSFALTKKMLFQLFSSLSLSVCSRPKKGDEETHIHIKNSSRGEIKLSIGLTLIQVKEGTRAREKRPHRYSPSTEHICLNRWIHQSLGIWRNRTIHVWDFQHPSAGMYWLSYISRQWEIGHTCTYINVIEGRQERRKEWTILKWCETCSYESY